jgi:hypothetical protein
MKYWKLFLILFCLLIAGCGTPHNDPAIMAQNRVTLSGKGEQVGTLPDGREIRRYYINMGKLHDHWIYVTNDTITINRTISQGKTTFNHVSVIINGIEYKPVEKEE